MWNRTFFMSFIVLAVACADGGNAGRPSTAFSAEHAKLFDDGADLLADPDALEGKWGVDWDTEMRSRVQSSDVIAVAKVTTLRTDVDPQGQTTYHVVAQPTQVWKGQVPGDGLSLSSKEGAVGYASIDSQKQALLNQSFVVFVKWYSPSEGAVAAHWHMATATEPVLARVRTQMESLAPTHQTITTTHEQSE